MAMCEETSACLTKIGQKIRLALSSQTHPSLNSATRCPSMGLQAAPLAAVTQNDQQVAALSHVQTSQRRFQEGPERGRKRAKQCFYSLT